MASPKPIFWHPQNWLSFKMTWEATASKDWHKPGKNHSQKQWQRQSRKVRPRPPQLCTIKLSYQVRMWMWFTNSPKRYESHSFQWCWTYICQETWLLLQTDLSVITSVVRRESSYHSSFLLLLLLDKNSLPSHLNRTGEHCVPVLDFISPFESL